MSKTGNLALKDNGAFDFEKLKFVVLSELDPSKLAIYLKEPQNVIDESLPIIADSLVRQIAELCLSDKIALAEMINFVRMFNLSINEDQSLSSNVLDLSADAKKFNRFSDYGTNFLKQLFQGNLNKTLAKVSSESKLQDESDFTLVAIIATKFLIYLKNSLSDENNDTFSYMEIFQQVLGLNVNDHKDDVKPKAEITQKYQPDVEVTKKIGMLAIVLAALPLLIISFSIYDFYTQVSSSGKFSSFSIFNSLENKEEIFSKVRSIKNKIVNFLNFSSVVSPKTNVIGDEIVTLPFSRVSREPKNYDLQIAEVNSRFPVGTKERDIGNFLFTLNMSEASFFLPVATADKIQLRNISELINVAVKTGISIQEIVLLEGDSTNSKNANGKQPKLVEATRIKNELIVNGVDSKIINIKDAINKPELLQEPVRLELLIRK